jgi:hypothetical protein
MKKKLLAAVIFCASHVLFSGQALNASEDLVVPGSNEVSQRIFRMSNANVQQNQANGQLHPALADNFSRVNALFEQQSQPQSVDSNSDSGSNSASDSNSDSDSDSDSDSSRYNYQMINQLCGPELDR